MKTCSLCDSKHYAKGHCRKHYMRWYTHGDPEFMLKSYNNSLCFCGRKHYGKGLCNAHWQRMRRVGSVLHLEMGYEIRSVECQR